MQKIRQTIGAVFGRMFRALFMWGIAIGAVATGWFSYSAHHFPRAGEWGLIIGLTIAAGLLGAMATLVWELSHLGTISRAIRHTTTPK